MSLSSNKKPSGKDNYIGLEIECLANVDDKQAEKIIRKYPIAKTTQLKDDGSIDIENSEDEKYHIDKYCEHCDGGYNLSELIEHKGKCWACNKFIRELTKEELAYKPLKDFELAFLFKEKDLRESIIQIKAILKEMKAKVNSSCGLHVHLDMRNRDPNVCFARLLTHQDMLFKLVKKNRRNNPYCQSVPPDTTVDQEYGGHHAAINSSALSEHNTLEIRLHHGTVNTREIYRWIKLLTTIVEGKKPGWFLNKYIKEQTNAMKVA
jgi:hypothetical protein